MVIDKSIGERLRRLRVERGYSQKYVADNVHCDEKYLSYLECRKCNPSLDFVKCLAKFYGKTPDYILYGTANRPHTGQNPDFAPVENPTPRNSTGVTPHSKREGGAPRLPHGTYRNVFLSQEEYAALAAELPNLDDLIEAMSCYCAAKGTKYTDYTAALRGWARKGWQRNPQPKIDGPDTHDYEEDCL